MQEIDPASMPAIAEQARPGERCQFHPDCCDMDDRDCPGCGEPAVRTLVYARTGQRIPLCAAHELIAGAATAGAN
jgi:hypothetical protein